MELIVEQEMPPVFAAFRMSGLAISHVKKTLSSEFPNDKIISSLLSRWSFIGQNNAFGQYSIGLRLSPISVYAYSMESIIKSIFVWHYFVIYNKRLSINIHQRISFHFSRFVQKKIFHPQMIFFLSVSKFEDFPCIVRSIIC